MKKILFSILLLFNFALIESISLGHYIEQMGVDPLKDNRDGTFRINIDGTEEVDSLDGFNNILNNLTQEQRAAVISVTIRNTNVSVIPEDLFRFLPNLRIIDFNGNQIQDVTFAPFEHLNDLHSLDFLRNPLSDASRSSLRDSVDALGREFYLSTSDL